MKVLFEDSGWSIKTITDRNVWAIHTDCENETLYFNAGSIECGGCTDVVPDHIQALVSFYNWNLEYP